MGNDKNWLGNPSRQGVYPIGDGQFTIVYCSFDRTACEFNMIIPTWKRYSGIPSWNYIACVTQPYHDYFVIWGLDENETHDQIIARMKDLCHKAPEDWGVLAKGRYGQKDLEIVHRNNDDEEDFRECIRKVISVCSIALWSPYGLE